MQFLYYFSLSMNLNVLACHFKTIYKMNTSKREYQKT